MIIRILNVTEENDSSPGPRTSDLYYKSHANRKKILNPYSSEWEISQIKKIQSKNNKTEKCKTKKFVEIDL